MAPPEGESVLDGAGEVLLGAVDGGVDVLSQGEEGGDGGGVGAASAVGVLGVDAGGAVALGGAGAVEVVDGVAALEVGS